MLKKIKKFWQNYLKEVEEYRKEDLQKKYLVIRSYVMGWYKAKHEDENNPIPYWIEANKELEKNIKTDADILFYYSKIKNISKRYI